MTERDRSLVEHLAVKVLTWKPVRNWEHVWDVVGSYRGDINLDSWADAGMVWEKAQTMPGVMNSVQEWLCRMNVGHLPSAPFLWFLEKASPRVLSEAVAWATGWEEHKVNE